MNILLLTQIVPFPPHSGPRVKTYHLLRYLAEQHQVTLVTFTRNAEEEAHANTLRRMCAAVHTVHLHRSRPRDLAAVAASLVSGTPFLIERDSSTAMHHLLAELVAAAGRQGEPFDLVHADQLNMAQFAEPLPLPRLLDQHNAVWAILERIAKQETGPKRIFLEREQRLLQRYEGHVCATFEAVTAVSEEDRRALLHVMPQPRDIPIIPIAVDAATQQPVARTPGAKGVLSLATMMYPPNVDAVCWFARDIYPLVRRAVPDTHFYVCGQRPVPEVRALPEKDPSIEVTGYVPDVQPYIANSACLIVPLRSGGGMRVKILEALAWGIPIVSTTVGYEGIDLKPGEHLLVADTPSDFADAVTLLLRDPESGSRIAAAGRQRLLERYDWQAVCPAMDAVYQRMMAEKATHPVDSVQSSQVRHA
jgi:polysaccharide biosynthesis protein PslH